MIISKRKIYIVASYSGTLPGKIIVARAMLKFWNRYAGDSYSHVSISLDDSLTDMYSFARRKVRNPLDAGMIRESIYGGMFALKRDISRIAVFEINVSNIQYRRIKQKLTYDWQHRDQMKYNFLGLITQLLIAKGCSREGRYFCSQWVAEVLRSCGMDLFPGKPADSIKPFDFYGVLYDCCIYEGLTKNYLREGSCQNARAKNA